MGEEIEKPCHWCGISVLVKPNRSKMKTYCDRDCESASEFIEYVGVEAFFLSAAVFSWIVFLYSIIDGLLWFSGITLGSILGIAYTALFLYLFGEIPRIWRIRKDRPKNSRSDYVQ